MQRKLRDQIRKFLTTNCGVELSMEKTRITHVRDGFDFLGFHLLYWFSVNRNHPVLTDYSKWLKKRCSWGPVPRPLGFFAWAKFEGRSTPQDRDTRPSNLDSLALGLLPSRALSSNKHLHPSKFVFAFKQQPEQSIQDASPDVRRDAALASDHDLAGLL